MQTIISIAFNGVSYGMVLFLVAAGMSMVLGIMGITNMAHGTIYMIGAYVGQTVFVQWGMNFWIAAIAGGLVGGAVGFILERFFLRKLYRQANEQVLLTFGFVYILKNAAIWIWGGRGRLQFTDPAYDRTITWCGVNFGVIRFVILITGLVIALLLWYMQDKTNLGSKVKAGMDDKEMTVGLGINLNLVQAVVFFISSFIGGFAGTIGAQLLGVSNSMGSNMFMIALIIIIVGGVGSVQGALLGAVIIGLVDAFGKAFFPSLSMFSMYLAMIIILLIRPQGLLGRKV